jgi:hypothetical protein
VNNYRIEEARARLKKAIEEDNIGIILIVNLR